MPKAQKKTEEVKPAPTSTLPVVRNPEGTALANWEDELEQDAKDARAAFVSGVPRITVDTFKFHANGDEIGDTISFATVNWAWAKQFYEAAYAPGKSATPDCYAFGRQEKGLIPHEAAPDKQAEQCDGCPHNKFFTARVGKGKRCGDKPRLMVIFSHDVEGGGEKKVRNAGCYQLDIPAGSIPAFNEYLSLLKDCTPHGNISEAITEVRVQPRKGGGHELKFAFIGKVPLDAMPALVARRKSAFEQLTQPFPVLGEAEEQAPQKPLKGQKGKR